MPDWKDLVRRRLATLRLNAAAEAELAEEIAQDLEDTYRELRSGGAAEEAARAGALRELEDVDALRTLVERKKRMPKHDPVPAGDARAGNWLGDLWRDLRYAGRSMRRTPLFVVFAVGTLALGIGANTTMFTVINTLILNPIPAPRSGELQAVAAADAGALNHSAAPLPISYREFRDVQARNQVFRSLAGYTGVRQVTIQENGAAGGIFAEFVTHEYFDTLALTPAKGRFFSAEDDAEPVGRPVAVLNYGTWQTRFGARADIIGSTVRLNGLDLTIVGVTPPHFIGLNVVFGPEIWIPATMVETLLPRQMEQALTDRSKALFRAVGRLNPGLSRPQAQANLSGIAAGLAREFPKSNEGRTLAVRPLRDALLGWSASGATPVLFASAVLLAVVGIVLLIACSNVANLLLARSSSRRQEMAVRLAMGASRRRLVRQLLTESVVLGCLSGALGLFLSYAGLQLLFGVLPSAATFVTPKLDATVLAFALLVSLGTGFLFGTMPALRISRSEVAETLKEEARTAGRNRRRITLGNALVVGQVAFSLLLLVTAALFLRSIGRAYELDPGFQTAHLAVFITNPGQAGYGKARTTDFYRATRDRVAALPGVASVSWASNLPLWAAPVNGLEIEGRQLRSATDTLRSIVTTVDVDYFETAGVRMVSGREFSKADRETSEPVAIVNQKLERDYWPAGAIGRRVRLPGETQWRKIVGVARTANYSTWAEAPQLCVYVPLDQRFSDAMTLFVRTQRDPAEALAPVTRELRAAGPEVMLGQSRSGAELVWGALFQARMAVTLLTIFGLLALGLASIGLYGILAYSVNQRRREIGLRMALGASRTTVLRQVLREGMSLVAAGMALGLVAAIPVGRVLGGMLYGVTATDPLSMGAAVLALSAIALLACYLPAHLATRVDPLKALREV